MICIPTEIPQELCAIYEKLKAIYHSKDSFCFWVFQTRADRNRFMDATAGMDKDAREGYCETYLV
tara:strand:+ start:394 stop:588 length:195 start_codon:yes stop_codon:yes gene_type:complete